MPAMHPGSAPRLGPALRPADAPGFADRIGRLLDGARPDDDGMAGGGRSRGPDPGRAEAGFAALLERAILPAARRVQAVLEARGGALVLDHDACPGRADPATGRALPCAVFRLARRDGAAPLRARPAPPGQDRPCLAFTLRPRGVVEITGSGLPAAWVAAGEFGPGDAEAAFEALVARAARLRAGAFPE